MNKRILLAILLFLASLNLRPAINSIAPLLDNIRLDLGMSGSISSLLTSIPVLCLGLFSPIAVKAGAKWGLERIIGFSLVFIAIGTAIRWITHATPFLLITAFIAGIGIAFITPLMAGFITKYFPDKVPTMIAIYSVSLTLGAALSSSLSVVLEQFFDSWQISLASWSVLAIIASTLWWLIVRVPESESTISSNKIRGSFPWKNNKAWILSLSFGLMALLFFSFNTWLPQIVQGMGYSKAYATTTLTIFVLVQIPVSLLIPVLLRKSPSRRLWLIFGSAFEFAGLLLLALHAVPWIASALIGIGAGSIFSLNLLLPIDATTNANEAAAWSAMVQSTGYVIGATGPILLGQIHDATESFTSAIVIMLVIVVLMGFVQFASTSNGRKETIRALQTS